MSSSSSSSSNRDSASPVYIPLMNIPRANLRLRPEFVPVLARAGINDVEELITVDDVSSAELDAGKYIYNGLNICLRVIARTYYFL